MTDELRLLREYAENASEEAFAAVLSRHIRMVYAAAMRHTGNPHEAEEITQAVFIILARKAGQLPRGTVLSGWLFQTTRLTACSYIRNAARRRNREREATMQSNLEKGENDDVWRQVAPLLDSAVASLRAKDRDAVVMRYVEGRPLDEVGLAMGASESAAQRRIHRALERLRKFFAKRGVVLTGAILAGSIAANAAPAAPAGLTASVATVAVLKGATAGASTIALIEGTLKALAWAKLKLAAGIGASVALATGTVVFAVGYTADASHDKTELVGATLSANSPFIRFLSETPWIKRLQFVHGNFAVTNTNPNAGMVWVRFTNTFGVQPSGSYISLSPRMFSGVNDQVYWSANEKMRLLRVTPVDPDTRYNPIVENFRSRMEEAQYLGLPALRPWSFVMHEDGSFTATTLKDELLKGRILKASNDRPLALTYQFISQGTPAGTEEFNVSVIYQYVSEVAPLPSIIGRMERSQVRQQSVFSGPNQSMTINGDRDGLSISTNYILSAEYGVDSSITNGYSATMFFPDANQYRLQSNWWAD
jgi:RNA polymerase sigma factor (sigma-70 family)